MVNVVVWMILGGIIGLLGSLVLRSESERAVMINLTVAMAGAVTAELILTPLWRAGGLRSDFSLLALGGGVALLAIYSSVRGLANRYRPGQ